MSPLAGILLAGLAAGGVYLAMDSKEDESDSKPDKLPPPPVPISEPDSLRNPQQDIWVPMTEGCLEPGTEYRVSVPESMSSEKNNPLMSFVYKLMLLANEYEKEYVKDGRAYVNLTFPVQYCLSGIELMAISGQLVRIEKKVSNAGAPSLEKMNMLVNRYKNVGRWR